MSDLQVLIAGAGPTGLTLACDLARRGVAVRVIDQAPGPFPGSRAKGVTPRTAEVLDDLGLAQEAARTATPVVMRHYGRDGTFTDQRPASYWQTSPAEPHPQLLLPQWRTEAILRSLLGRLGVTVEYATRLIRFEQDGKSGATVRLFDIFRGSHFTLVGFGQSSRSSLDAVRDAWPGPLRTCLIAEAGTLTDADGHAADGYGVTGEAMVLVRPDGHLALTVEAHDTVTVLTYLEALKRLPPGRLLS
ncbi:FAD-dependent monooxygenase [Nonomuraea sp. NPDC048901]|uniref:FAD-dependent monooxygenase n=1 Tax=Nonomuraea sp. NPDC048901 TaxID=3155627 RepID=UPI00340ADFE7